LLSLKRCFLAILWLFGFLPLSAEGKKAETSMTFVKKNGKKTDKVIFESGSFLRSFENKIFSR